MKQLTLKDIYLIADGLKQKGEDIDQYPIYLGNDDELNGIHCGWYTNLVDANDKDEDNQYFVEMINEDHCNIKLQNKALLIS